METNFTDDLNTIHADDLADAESSFEENLTTPEDVAEYEEWLDDVMDGDHASALESVYGPDE